MASISETGHAKNVANFEKLISTVSALGTVYNPSKANLKLTALSTKLTETKTAIAAVNSAEAEFKNAVSARDVAFKPLSKFITRVNNALKASNTTTQVDESAMTLIRKLQGRRATPKMSEEEKKAVAATGKEVVEISSSQLSFDNRLDNLAKLIQLLKSVPEYAPNEEDLKVESLSRLLEDLTSKNNAVTKAEISLNNARILRNEVMYKPLTGIVDTCLDVKAYIKSIFGATSAQYKQVSKLEFKTVKV